MIVGSYGGEYTVKAEKEQATWIVYSGNQGKRFGETRLFLAADHKVQHQLTFMHFLTRTYPSNETMQAFLDELPIPGPKTSAVRRPAGKAFLGNLACKNCHENAYTQWESTSHAHAFATLEAEGKHAVTDCQSCHVTGATAEGGFQDPQSTPHLASVGCESCHGPGAAHVDNQFAAYGKMTIDTCTACHDVENSPKFDYYSYLPRVTHGRRASN